MRPLGQSENQGSEAGFVLPAVLAILIVVCALLAATVLRVRSGTALAQARGDIAMTQGLADGIVRAVAYDLGLQRSNRIRGLQLPENGRPVSCAFGPRQHAIVALQDQGLLVDLNTTPRPALEEAMRALGVPDGTALKLAAEIVDDRDPDDVPEPGGGAEAPQYRAQGLNYGPRNAPFISVDEIDRLPSMTEDLAQLLKPNLTIYNESGRAAGPRAQTQEKRADAKSVVLPPTPSPRQYFRIDVLIETQGVRAGRSAIYSLGGTNTGTAFLTWQPSIPTLSPPAVGHPACAALAAALRAE